ncbi:hypothetical protein JXR01_03045 [Candidatus Kaiserbacteria bacterium]|nr:MAG: hypothetical protein JXR01_03045 [Candidatus Kaiserbacteria bacterium]
METRYTVSRDGTTIEPEKAGDHERDLFDCKFAVLLAIGRVEEAIEEAAGQQEIELQERLNEYRAELKSLNK